MLLIFYICIYVYFLTILFLLSVFFAIFDYDKKIITDTRGIKISKIIIRTFNKLVKNI